MESNERELRLADLGAMILKSFKGIVALTLALALLGGVFGAYREIRREQKTTVTEEDVKKAEKSLTATQKKLTNAQKSLRKRVYTEIPDAERNIRSAELLVERRQQYINDSIYQSMDPFNHAVSRLSFYVETDVEINPNTPWLGSDPQSSIALAFTRAYDKDTKILDEIRRIMNTEADVRYIKELVSVSSSSNRFVEIAVYYEDAEIAEKVVNYLYQELSARMEENIGEFSANVISRFTGYEVDWSMSDKQNEKQNELISAQRALEEANETLQSLQDGVEEKETQVAELEELLNQKTEDLEQLRRDMDIDSLQPMKILKKALVFLLAGGFLGLAGGVFIAIVQRLAGGKLQNQNDMRSRYDFPVLGQLPGRKERIFAKTISGLEGEMHCDYDAAAQAAVQSVKSVAGDRRVALISTQGTEQFETLTKLGGDQFAPCGNILEDAGAIKAMVDCDSVLLVEQKERSRISLIDTEVLRAKALGKDILGAVIADSEGRKKHKDKAIK